MATCTGTLTPAQKNIPQEVKQQEDKIPMDISLLTVCVGGGDAIFIIIKYSEKEKHCYLVDGGRGKGGAAGGPCPHSYTTAVKVDEGVPLISDFLKLKAAYEDLERNGYVLQAIMVTHPDQDHYEGIKHLLRQKKPECQIILTEQFLHKANPKQMDDKENHVKLFLKIVESANKCEKLGTELLSTYYPLNNNWLKFHNDFSKLMFYEHGEQTEQLHVLPTCTSTMHNDDNETSTITTVYNPGNPDQILAVLTGDANFKNEKTRAAFIGKRVPLFLVPHHGSANNSDYYFYERADIDVYLISCGNHLKFKFPRYEALNAINRAVATKAKKEAKIVLTNGRHLNNTKMSCVKSGTETSLLDEWKTWQSIEIYYWDEYIYEEPYNPLITKPWLDYHLYPTPQLSTDNLIQWSIEGYKKMAKSYTTKWNAEVTVTKEGTTNPYLRVMKNEISFGNQPEKLNVIKNIPSPHSPCDWDSENTTLVLTDTLDGSDGPVFLQFPDLKSTTERLWKEFTICRCHKLPWLIQYMESVNDNGTIKWSTTIYNGCQEQPAQVTVVKNN